MTITGYQKKIMAAVPDISRNKAERLATKIAKRAAAMQEQFDFYEALRILGITSDTTACDAVRNIEDASRKNRVHELNQSDLGETLGAAA